MYPRDVALHSKTVRTAAQHTVPGALPVSTGCCAAHRSVDIQLRLTTNRFNKEQCTADCVAGCTMYCWLYCLTCPATSSTTSHVTSSMGSCTSPPSCLEGATREQCTADEPADT